MSTWVAMDVAYGEAGGREVGVAAGVVFDGGRADVARAEHVVVVRELRPYVPGRFYERELPCLLAVLDEVAAKVDVLIVDGYVWLDDERRPGLGAELHRALGGTTPVIGAAKTAFRGAPAREVLRGGSERPLYVTAAGMDAVAAARHIETMHGAHRLPTMLKRVDVLGREALRSCR